MAQQWEVRRSTVTRPDAQQRWDTVYQFLLQWTTDQVRRLPTERQPHPPEECYGDRRVCTGLDPSPATDPDD